MSDFVVLAAAETKITNWLTPVWIFGLGAAIGLGILLAIWGVSWLLSRVRVLSSLADHRWARWLVAAVIAVVPFSLLMWKVAAPAMAQSTETGGTAVVNYLVAIGVFAALSYLIGLCCVMFMSRRTVSEVPMALREGVLFPLSILVLIMAAFGVVATFFIPPAPVDMIASIARIPETGRETLEIEIQPPNENVDIDEQVGQEIAVDFSGKELQGFEFRSGEPLELASLPFADVQPGNMIELEGGDEPRIWRQSPFEGGAIPQEPVSKLYVRNMGAAGTTLTMSIVTAPEYPQMMAVPVTALFVVVLYLAYFLQRSVMPRISAIALSTSKSEISQPVFLVLLAVWTVVLIVHVFIPYFTFGEDIKMLKDAGLVLIKLVGIFLAIWAASKSISDEIEGRTALTVLSKPIGRRGFIFGKLLGITWMLALLFIVLGVVFLIAIAYKPLYDARESTVQDVTWRTCYLETVLIVPGLLLAFMETVVFAALSVAISTRFSMLANFLTCFAIYVLGHLTPLMVQSSVAVEAFEPVVFIGQLIATVFPVLHHFDIQAAIASGRAVPLAYLGWSLLYCVIYSTIAMLLALVLFEDRDLT